MSALINVRVKIESIVLSKFTSSLRYDPASSFPSDIVASIVDQVYCHAKYDSADAVPHLLLDAQDHLGKVMWHDRSRQDGLVPVRFKPEIASGERLISDNSGEAKAHMDGVFMPSPPRIIALGVVEMSSGAPQTYSIDFQALLEHLADDCILRHARQDAIKITRGSRTTTFTPLEFVDGRVQIRYRFDEHVSLSTSGGSALFQEMHEIIDEMPRSNHALGPGSVIFLDNCRMLHGRAAFDPTQASRFLLRAWYPAADIPLGVPWHGRLPNSRSNGRSGTTFIDGHELIFDRNNGIVIQSESGLQIDDGFIFALKQALGFRHAPCAWTASVNSSGVRLEAKLPESAIQDDFGAALETDLTSLL